MSSTDLAREPSRSQGPVLVVDDGATYLGVLDGLPAPLGDDVSTASSGNGALDAVAAWVPDVILLDVMMPDIDGLIREHPARGEQIVMPLVGPGPVRSIMRHHNERWDGTGYPDGLAGEEIPILARAFQLLDVFDAFTSRRPYKPAFGRHEAVATVSEDLGTKLDPDLGRVLLGQVAGQCEIETQVT